MSISENQFYMWRALFAVIHADNKIDENEVEFAMTVLDEIDFSDDQRHILCEDLRTPQNAADMFAKIKDTKEQAKFFKFAGEMVWADDDYAREEEELMLLLEAQHLKDLDLEEMAGEMSLEFEDATGREADAGDLKSAVSAFKAVFF